MPKPTDAKADPKQPKPKGMNTNPVPSDTDKSAMELAQEERRRELKAEGLLEHNRRVECTGRLCTDGSKMVPM